MYSIGSKPWKQLCEESSDQVCDCAGEVLGVVNGVDMIGFVTGAGFGAMMRCVEFSRVERSASVSILMVSSVFVLT